MFKRSAVMLGGLSLLILLSMGGQVSASDISSAVPQSFNADAKVLPGMIVGLKSTDSKAVEPIKFKMIDDMLGVVIPPTDAPLSLTSPTSAFQQVLVASSGRHNLLVTNQNGAIKSGDYLTISALPGIGMKAGAAQPKTIGRAAANFNGSNNVIGISQLKNDAGAEVKVSIGYALVDVSVKDNPLQKNDSKLPDFLSNAANGVANKPVTPARLYLSMVALVTTFFIAGSMLYAGVRSSIAATGRNPLARKMIGLNLFQTVIAGLVVFAAGIFTIYLILNL